MMFIMGSDVEFNFKGDYDEELEFDEDDSDYITEGGVEDEEED